jgi:hypothetical protein
VGNQLAQGAAERAERARSAREADAGRDVAGAESKAASGAPPAAAPPPLARSEDAEARLRLRPAEPENERANLTVEQTRRTDVLDRRIVLTSKETAEQVVGGPVATVEGVPIQEYYLLEGRQVVQTVQRLPDGGVLELDQWRVAVAGGAAAAASPRALERSAQRSLGDRVMAAETLMVDGLRIVARAPIPADSLRALLKRLRREGR